MLSWFVWIWSAAIWLALVILTGIGAKNKGRDAAAFVFLSILLSPLVGLVAVAIAKPIAQTDTEIEPEKITPEAAPAATSKGAEIACPNCGKPKISGQMCPSCGSWSG